MIKEHAVGVALAMREKGQAENDLLARLAGDERLGCPALDGLLADPLAVHRRGDRAGRGGRPAGSPRSSTAASRGRRLHPGSDPVKLLHSGKVRDVYAGRRTT